MELLIHIGIDTVQLDGKYFTAHIEQGQRVERGQLLVEADMKAIEAEGYDITTPVVICNSDEFSEFHMPEPGAVSQGDEIMTLKK